MKTGHNVIGEKVFFLILQLTVKALHVRPESGRSPQECCLRVSLMPLRLNIDQVCIAGVIHETVVIYPTCGMRDLI